jgi:PHP family Zn ribbon phosphoesterase
MSKEIDLMNQKENSIYEKALSRKKKIEEFAKKYKNPIKVLGLIGQVDTTYKKISTLYKEGNQINEFEFPDIEIPIENLINLTEELKDLIPVWKKQRNSTLNELNILKNCIQNYYKKLQDRKKSRNHCFNFWKSWIYYGIYFIVYSFT